MKKRPVPRPSTLRAFRLAALLGLAAGLPPAARAVTYTWTGNGASFDQTNWSYAGNWIGGRPVGSTSTDLIFGSPGPGNATGNYNDLSDPFTLRSLNFTADATAYQLSGGDLHFDGGAGATLTTNTANTITINNAITASDNLTINLGAGAGPPLLAGGLGTAGSTFTINAATVGGAGNILGGNLTGRAALNIVGAGTLTLTGNNTYTTVFKGSGPTTRAA